MMYELLAHVYDALVKDDEATQEWVSLIKKHIKGKELLELACGSGEITIALAQEGYQVTASDLSADMIAEARKKSGSELVEWSVMDMCELHMEKQFDGILCLCDSFNYVL
ncbi:MAG: class I SAM-dependent methyltransferase, partial [Clostridium sp.]|nr:class I SAM-dependent methyltransferase [Clostridium sp.]